MKKRDIFLLFSTLLNVVLIFVLVRNVQKPVISELTSEERITPSRPFVPENQSGVIGEKTQNAQYLKVTKVIDGDTIVLENGEILRYIGIDTPESSDPRKPVECFSKEASQKNKELVEGKLVSLETDISERDKYQRLLRYVWVGEVFVNDYLVREGYATSVSYPPDIKYQEQFRQAQLEARDNNRGLWSSCGGNAASSSVLGSEDKDCGDFKTQSEAQDFFISQGGPGSDPHKLDRDGDGKVCESLQ